jgi:hypothetical protein
MNSYIVTSRSVVYKTYQISAETETQAIEIWQADESGELPTYEEWTEKVSLHSIEEQSQDTRILSIYAQPKETQ